MLVDGFTVPQGAAAPMFPDEEEAFGAAWDVYGAALPPELVAAAQREHDAGTRVSGWSVFLRFCFASSCSGAANMMQGRRDRGWFIFLCWTIATAAVCSSLRRSMGLEGKITGGDGAMEKDVKLKNWPV